MEITLFLKDINEVYMIAAGVRSGRLKKTACFV